MKAAWLLLIVLGMGCSTDPQQQRAIAILRAGGATVQIDIQGDAASVDLRQCSLTPDIARALADLPRLKTLRVGKDYKDEDAALLSGLTGLESLDLSYSRAGRGTLAALKPLAGLRFLALNGLTLTDAEADLLAELPQLTSMSLLEAAVSEDALERLRSAHPRCLLVR